MELGLTGKTALISGSTQGIGFAIAEMCAAEGAVVIVNGRSEENVAAAVRRIHNTHPGAEVRGIAADVADPAQTNALLDELEDIDILVNNAGIFGVQAFAEIEDADWSRYLETDLMSGVRLSRGLMPRMLEAGWGRIVFIGTESAVDVPGDMIHYGAAKAASLALSNGLAKLTRGTGVTVNTVLGGPTYSDGVAGTVQQIATAQGAAEDELKSSLIRESSLIQRFIEPEEIASLTLFLASTRASAINGAALRADGGVLPTIL